MFITRGGHIGSSTALLHLTLESQLSLLRYRDTQYGQLQINYAYRILLCSY